MFPTGHKERSLTLFSPPHPLSGGFAPWPAEGSNRSKATAQLSVLIWLCAFLFTATITVSLSVTVHAWSLYRESVPPASVFLGVFEDGAGGSVCNSHLRQVEAAKAS